MSRIYSYLCNLYVSPPGVSLIPVASEVYSCDDLVSDWQHVCGFFKYCRLFPPSIKLTTGILNKILLKMV